MRGNFVGNLLRMERVRQGKGQKEICYGICVTSYLCKIEKGQVKADEAIIKKLFKQLGIDYCQDEQLLEEASTLIKQYYEQVHYNLPRTAFERLKQLEDRLKYSPLGLDYRLICGMQGEAVYEMVKSCEGCMTDEQLGIFYLLTPTDRTWEELLEAYEKAYKLLGTSASYYNIMIALLQLGRYAEIHRRAKICRELAIEEGNTYILSATFLIQGHAYAVLDLDEFMMEYYERGLRLLQNTNWIEDKELESVYYNMGSVFVTTKDYQKALEYLDKVTVETFMLCQKKALVHIRTRNVEEAQIYLEKMKDYLKDPAYLEILERLQKVIKEERHFGYLYFYREQIIEAYSAQKKYKKALAFQKEISSKVVVM